MTKGKKTNSNLGRLFGKPDIERCGLFIDFGVLNWDEYTGRPVVFHEDAKQGNQMYSSVPSGGHKKCGLQGSSGYFDEHFKSIFVDDPYLEKWKIGGRPPAHPRKGAWIPSGPSKGHSTPGDHYGTFTKSSEMSAFSPLKRQEKPKQKEPMNFITNPGKKGNSGYVDICINKYPSHSVKGKVDSYVAAGLLYSKNWRLHKVKIRSGPMRAGFFPRPYFESNPYREHKSGPTYVEVKKKGSWQNRGVFYPPSAPKKMGNNHDGCFEKFTSWSPEPYKTQKEIQKELSHMNEKQGLVFRPEPRLKSYYTTSVVNNKIDISCNERTWRTMKPVTYTQFSM